MALDEPRKIVDGIISGWQTLRNSFIFQAFQSFKSDDILSCLNCANLSQFICLISSYF